MLVLEIEGFFRGRMDILPFEISRLSYIRAEINESSKLSFLSIPTVDFYLNNNVRYLYLLIESEKLLIR